MGKRSNFERRERDFYKTPKEAIYPLMPFVSGYFVEPCAGDGALVGHLQNAGLTCWFASDIEPQVEDIWRLDALKITNSKYQFITNPPWRRDILQPLIEHLSAIQPTWFLMDADWKHTCQSAPYMKICERVVSVGRLKWIEDSRSVGKDNCCWYKFDAAFRGETSFTGRQAK